MNRRTFLQAALGIPMAAALPVAASSSSTFSGVYYPFTITDAVSTKGLVMQIMNRGCPV